jgi:hypothetical protein
VITRAPEIRPEPSIDDILHMISTIQYVDDVQRERVLGPALAGPRAV